MGYVYLLIAAVQAKATHVVIDHVDKSVWPPDSGWLIFSAVAAAAAAIATAVLAFLTRNLATATQEMARKTADLATETKEQVEKSADAFTQAERHHQQSLMPVVYVEARCYAEDIHGRNLVLFEGEVVNIGPGAATEIMVYLLCGTYEGTPRQEFPEQKIYLGMLAPNSRAKFQVGFNVDDNFIPVPGGRVYPYQAFTTFKSVFGVLGGVLQISNTGEAKDALISLQFDALAENYKHIEQAMQTYRFQRRIGDYRDLVT